MRKLLIPIVAIMLAGSGIAACESGPTVDDSGNSNSATTRFIEVKTKNGKVGCIQAFYQSSVALSCDWGDR